jgi:hypothetical protein
MLEDILKYDLKTVEDPADVRRVMGRLKASGYEAAYWEAFKWCCDLQGKNFEDPLEQDFAQVLAAYEELLTAKNGKTTKANRTRQKMQRKTITQCLEDWATGKTETPGFKLLIENKMPELTAEYLVLKYPTRFSHETVSAAETRLRENGVEISHL